jgi:uncharacterized protein (TIGR00369 family)
MTNPSIQTHHQKLERMYTNAPINDIFQTQLAVTRGSAKLHFEVRPEHHHAAKSAHGAVIFKALDDAAFFAAQSLVEDFFIVTVSFNVHLIRPIDHGRLHATGQILHHGKRLLLASANAYDEQDRLVAQGTGHFMPTHTPLTAVTGYSHD